MPCFLFTYHGHATWMPDHGRGYVHRQLGLRPSDPDMADRYRWNQKEPTVEFTPEQLLLLVSIARDSGAHIDATIHAVFTEPTHVHVLVSWSSSRKEKSICACIRTAMSRAMNEKYGWHEWFSDNPSRRQILDMQHFKYLIREYCEKHLGAKWVRLEDLER